GIARGPESQNVPPHAAAGFSIQSSAASEAAKPETRLSFMNPPYALERPFKHGAYQRPRVASSLEIADRSRVLAHAGTGDRANRVPPHRVRRPFLTVQFVHFAR